jgi:hypothetical protein
LGFFDSVRDGSEIAVAMIHVKHIPTVGQESLFHILREGNRGITIDGDIYTR